MRNDRCDNFNSERDIPDSRQKPEGETGSPLKRPIGSNTIEAAGTSKTPKRPRDPAQFAKLVINLATGEQPDVARYPRDSC